jgi:hypothetical protein
VSFSKKTASTFDLEADSSIVFSPQDSLSFIFKRKVGDIVEGASGTGVQQILNGTGRFAGISGECTYKTQVLSGNWVVTHSACKWATEAWRLASFEFTRCHAAPRDCGSGSQQ